MLKKTQKIDVWVEDAEEPQSCCVYISNYRVSMVELNDISKVGKKYGMEIIGIQFKDGKQTIVLTKEDF